MPIHHTKPNLKKSPKNWQIVTSWFFPGGWPKHRWTQRLLTVFLALLVVFTTGMYGLAQWYIHSKPGPQTVGVSFIPDYAQALGVDPQQTMDALLGIGVKNFRLVSYWSDIEQTPGHYDFSQLDWQFAKAERAQAHITLTVGLRQPRWPECHIPDWAAAEPASQWQPQLDVFMTKVVQRYQHSPALNKYQLENEYFLQGFGTCTDYSRARLISEYKLLKRLDPQHPVILGRSNNDLGYPVGQPQPDLFSVSVYKRVWDAGFSHRYLEYPFPAWYYGFLAGWQELVNHRDMVLGELQAEAWPPNGKTIPETPLSEQNKSMDAQRLTDRIQYGKATGMRTIYLWGAEYWYYRAQVLHDPSLWQVAQTEFKTAAQ